MNYFLRLLRVRIILPLSNKRGVDFAMFKKALCIFIILSMILISGCNEQTGSNHQDIEKNTIEEIEENIDSKYSYPSEIAVSPDRDKFLFISPFQWEVIGEIYLLESNSIDKLVSEDDIEPQYTPKQVTWFNNNIFLVIIGYAYGTSSSGGELFYYDVEKKKMNKIDTINLVEHSQINNIRIDNDKIYIEIIEYNEDSSDYQLYTKVKELCLIEIEGIWDFDTWE